RMAKMRVYEYAKEKNVSSKEVLDQLKKLNIEVANHMSSITANTREKLDKAFNKNDGKQMNGKEQQKEQAQHNEQKQKNANEPKRVKENQNRRGKQRSKVKNKQGNKQAHTPQKQTEEKVGHLVYSNTLTVDKLAQKINKDVAEI